ncbi:hypothetical protein [Enterococcus massiliensis]|uniref:hypothetical protein n=1 Tax=Enterococcus massiliensis TaxID=1640685 RepID=UPI0011C9A160|nr:hypothetical protein [Enterococcus massiliensis]
MSSGLLMEMGLGSKWVDIKKDIMNFKVSVTIMIRNIKEKVEETKDANVELIFRVVSEVLENNHDRAIVLNMQQTLY